MQAASPGELPVKEGDLVTVTLPDVGQGWSQVPLIVMVMLGLVVVRGRKDENFPDSRFSRAKTFRTEKVRKL